MTQSTKLKKCIKSFKASYIIATLHKIIRYMSIFFYNFTRKAITDITSKI